jgi:(2Fe-2S) ferredoxin
MEVLLVGSVPITGLCLATDEHYVLLYCLYCLLDVVEFIFGVRVNDWFPTECLADCRFNCIWNNAVISPLKDCFYSCGFDSCMFVSREGVSFNIYGHS